MSGQQTLLDVDPTARHEDDFYATPSYQTRALLRRIQLRRRHRILEPCVGDGAIIRALGPLAEDMVTNDIVARPPMTPDFLLDARRPESWTRFAAAPIDVCLTNPPFDVAFDIASCALPHVRVALVLLLRLSWLEPTEERGDWLRKHPPTTVITLPRTDYRDNGKTDSVTSAWMIWSRHLWFCEPGFDTVTKHERDALIAQERR